MFNPIRTLIDNMFDGHFKVASWVLVEVKKNITDTPTKSFLVKTTFGELNGLANQETNEASGEASLDERYLLIRPEDISDFSIGGGDYVYFLENGDTKPEAIDKAIKLTTHGNVYQIDSIYPMRGLGNKIDYYILRVRAV